MIARLLSAPLLIAVIAVALGTTIDALVKGIAPSMGVVLLVAWRFLFGGLIALAVFLAQKRPMPKWPAIRFHSARSLVHLFCAFTFFYGLTQLRLAEATTLGFTAALMVAPIARIIVGEQIKPIALLAALVGFCGVALAVSGQSDEVREGTNRLLGVASILCSAVAYATGLVLLRLRARTEDATTIALFTNGVPALILLPVTFGLLGFPAAIDIPFLLLLGLLGYVVWFLMTLAYGRAPAQQLAPIEYTALIWSAVIGLVFFDEIPGWQLWAGAVIVIAACLIVAVSDRFETRRKTKMPLSSDFAD